LKEALLPREKKPKKEKKNKLAEKTSPISPAKAPPDEGKPRCSLGCKPEKTNHDRWKVQGPPAIYFFPDAP